MDRMMVCPLCGQLHQDGTDYCPVFLTKIPKQNPEAETRNQKESEENRCAAKSENGLATCTNCGYRGVINKPCDQCGHIIAISTVVASMPNGIEVNLPISEEIIIGRESNSIDISEALDQFDAVSRRHCSLRFDSQGKNVTIVDLGSTNGTWVNDEKDPIAPNKLFMRCLPIKLHLGQHTTIFLHEK